MQSPSILFNEGEPARSEGEVRFLLECALKTPAVPDWVMQLALTAWKQEPEFSHGKLLHLVKKLAKARAKAATEPQRSLWQRLSGSPSPTSAAAQHEWLEARLQEHFAEAKSAATAYSPSDKPDPAAIWWPNPTLEAGHATSLHDVLPVVSRVPLLDKLTPVGSAGSCFAVEISHWLQDNGFNYLITESHQPHDPHQRASANARWGILFNAPSLRQLVQRAFGVIETPRILWSDVRGGVKRFYDPFREDMTWFSREEYEQDYDRHVAATREALTRVEVFVMTLGMNETWFLKSTGHALSRAPWRTASSAVEQRVLTVGENVLQLEQMWATWKKFNPGVQLILSVSPTPMHATFRGEQQHVVTANCHSKAVLRVAAEEFVQSHTDVHYFPGYETVMYCSSDAWNADQRHVSQHAVARVMETFARAFVR